eukprot:CAMPEP_0113848492 /NCGR_PEP_ID=MMETSP0372-20130328/2513_1 /TAXON_ID=340204 /ORGANISM="Lankesteria abbotti" /LENGTH=73 /DNA_ID=CAMNT_0000817993 /DNA_START=285 /DNA_END=506 /DNA_ORIENTATION=+ /assembly_acc=CAM_ASM_000359
MQGKSEEALQVLDESLQVDAKNITTLSRKTQLLMALERYDEAAVVVQTALAIDPQNVHFNQMQKNIASITTPE